METLETIDVKIFEAKGEAKDLYELCKIHKPFRDTLGSKYDYYVLQHNLKCKQIALLQKKKQEFKNKSKK